jgi:hypothetical protein
MIDMVVRWVRRRLPVRDESERMEWTSGMEIRIDESEDAIRKIHHETDRLHQRNFMEQELMDRRNPRWKNE